MNLITIKPNLCKFTTCRDFVEEFHIGEQDFILASKSTYLKHFKDLNLNATVAFKSDYGPGEPTDIMCEAIMTDVLKSGCNRIIAIGGGAVIDIAKVLAVAGAGDTMDDLYDKAPDLTRVRDLIIVPTTCGTGSEVTAISILSRIRLNTKLGLVSPALYPDHAVLIPELLDDLPFSVFATSSLDALIHAIESALSPKANEVTRMFSYQAIDMILRGYRTIAEQGKDARTPLLDDFLLASTYAGIAFGNAGCAAVHALSYPLGADRHVAHGESNYAIFSGVIRKYREIRTDGELAVLGAKIAAILDCTEESAFDALETLLENILCRKPLHEYGVSEADLVTYTESVLQNQTRLLSNNFVSLSREDILDIYQSLY